VAVERASQRVTTGDVAQTLGTVPEQELRTPAPYQGVAAEQQLVALEGVV
jgi:hypothetical protein